MKSFAFVAFASVCQVASAFYAEWTVDWVLAAPDGFTRPVIGINGAWPPPVLDLQLNETVQIVLTNNLGNETTSIHWHGIENKRNNVNDGVVGLNQCGQYPGSTVTYNWVVSVPRE